MFTLDCVNYGGFLSTAAFSVSSTSLLPMYCAPSWPLPCTSWFVCRTRTGVCSVFLVTADRGLRIGQCSQTSTERVSSLRRLSLQSHTVQQRQVLPPATPVEAEGFIGIRSLRYLAHWCDVVVLSQRMPNFVDPCLGTGARRHVFRCTNETRDYGPCHSRVKALDLKRNFGLVKRSRDFLQRTFSAYVSIPQVDVQPFVVHKFSSQDRILQCTVEQISREADRRTVGRPADERVPRQNPAADSVEVYTVRPRQGSTALCGADLPNSRCFSTSSWNCFHCGFAADYLQCRHTV